MSTTGPRALVVGGDSPIGSALSSALRAAGFHVLASTRHPKKVASNRPFADLETFAGINALPAADWTFLVAAETRFLECARDPARTTRINTLAPTMIAANQAMNGGRVFLFSTIAVYDGNLPYPRETDPPNPTTAYGAQKLKTEFALQELCDKTIILRPAKVIPSTFPLFESWRQALAAKVPITPFSDMSVSPIWIGHLIDTCIKLVSAPSAVGVYHISASDQITYADIAAIIASTEGFNLALLKPVLASKTIPEDDNRTIWLPRFATLDCSRLHQKIGHVPTSAKACIDEYLANSSKGGLPPESGPV